MTTQETIPTSATHLHIAGEVLGKPVTALVDTGSQTTIIDETVAAKLGVTMTQLSRPQPINLADGTHYATVTKETTVLLKLSPRLIIRTRCLVLPIGEEMILGNNWLRSLQGVIYCQQDRLTVLHHGQRHQVDGIRQGGGNQPIRAAVVNAMYAANEIEFAGWT
ncbi:hypothetical protein LPJ62_006586, partial [Coemansia sp. RSA 2167]